jgi:thiosulfate/3-mercaptopyruvate sulfurtransferase
MKFILILFFTLNAIAYDAFIKPDTLYKTIQDENLILLDASDYASYNQSHISGAIHVDISKFLKSKYARLSGNFSQKVENEMQKLGINETSHIVIYSRTNKDDYLNATYLASIFLQHGFENVSILDGGYMAWIFKYNDVVTSKALKPIAKGNFKAIYNAIVLVDDEYLNQNLEIVSAKSVKEIFFDDLTLKSELELKKLFENELILSKETKVAIYRDTSLAAYANWFILYKMFDLKNMKIYKTTTE